MKVLFIFLLIVVSALCDHEEEEENDSSEEDDREPINLGSQQYFQGDVILRNPKTGKSLSPETFQLDHGMRNAILRTQRWPNRTIYYSIDSKYSARYLYRIMRAIRSIERHTCVRFKPRVHQKNYISITNTSGGCFSEGVGKRGGKQTISLMLGLKTTCFTRAIVIHELLHAVGLWHEHMRYDRAKHIVIHWEHLRKGAVEQFDVLPATRSSTYDVPYDYKSVMHYDAYSFSGDGNITIEPMDASYVDVIGKAKDASEHDWEKIRQIYECNGTSHSSQTSTHAEGHSEHSVNGEEAKNVTSSPETVAPPVDGTTVTGTPMNGTTVTGASMNETTATEASMTGTTVIGAPTNGSPVVGTTVSGATMDATTVIGSPEAVPVGIPQQDQAQSATSSVTTTAPGTVPHEAVSPVVAIAAVTVPQTAPVTTAGTMPVTWPQTASVTTTTTTTSHVLGSPATASPAMSMATATGCTDHLFNCRFFQTKCVKYDWVKTYCPRICGTVQC